MIKSALQRFSLAALTTMCFMQASFATVLEGANNAKADGSPASLEVSFKTVSNLLIFLVGAVAVIMMIIGGFRYVASQGESAAVKQAKDTLL
ncbi:MAG TPA: hypothetical protein VMR98_01725, partial [Candidatus Polarisedimenticolaceae bacterium]|nr:hypothetical protein [Candidatus Polarisedimenticolaceae bacterium]